MAMTFNSQGQMIPQMPTALTAAGVPDLNNPTPSAGPSVDANGDYQWPLPSQPGFNPIFNPATQNIAGTAQNLLAGDNLDTTGLNAFQSQALSQGPSQWAQQAGQQQNLLAMNAKDQGAQTVAGQGAAARASLASRGGLSSGAAERTAQGGANNYLSMMQGVNQQNTNNQMQIGMNDQQNKLSMMSQLPGMQQAAANFGLQKTQTQLGAQSTDIANQMQGAQAQNQWNQSMYNTNMSGYGAAQTANATKNASKW